MNFWIKVFQEFCSFPHRAQLSFYCSGYIHFVIFLPVCLLLVSIKYLLLLYSLTSSALLSHSHFLHSGYFHSQVKRDRLEMYFSDYFSSSILPNFLFLAVPFCLEAVTPWLPLFLYILTVLSFCPFLHVLSPFFLRPDLCPMSLCISCLRSKPSSSFALHAEILGERREPGWQRGWACGWTGGYQRWGQYRCQIGSGGDDLLLTIPRHLRSFRGHHLLHRLHRILKVGRW